MWSILSEIRGETTVILCFLLFQYTLPNTYPWASYTISTTLVGTHSKPHTGKWTKSTPFVSRSIHLGINALPWPQYSIQLPVTIRYSWRCIMVWTWRPAEKNVLEVMYCRSFQFESKNPSKMEHIPNNWAIKHALTVSPHLLSPSLALAKYYNCSPYRSFLQLCMSCYIALAGEGAHT